MDKKIIIILLSLLFLSCTSKQNIMIKNFLGTQNYQSKNYNAAIEKFYSICDEKLSDTTISSEKLSDYAKYNLALTYLQLGEKDEASIKFTELKNSDIKKIKSLSSYQLGVLSFKNNNYKLALSEFKNAIQTESDFLEAKINYEICLRLLENEPMENTSLQKTQSPNDKTIMDYIKEKEVQLWKSKNKEQSKKAPYDY